MRIGFRFVSTGTRAERAAATIECLPFRTRRRAWRDVALAQEFAGASGPHRFAETEALRTCRPIRRSQQRTLLLRLHALGNDSDPDTVRKGDDGVYRRRTVWIAG